MKNSDLKDVQWVKSSDKFPHGYGAVYVKNDKENNEVYYGTYRFKEHFLDEGYWMVINAKHNFVPTEWAEIPYSHIEFDSYKSIFNSK